MVWISRLAASLLILSCITAEGQTKKNFTRIFQFSIAPSLGTNGLHSGGYSNYFSINLTSGYSSSNYLLEVGGLSNLNQKETRGLQVAGLVNITGGNSFSGLTQKEIEQLRKSGFEANLSGAQLSGLTNIVLNNVFGLQATGAVNIAKGALQGVQLAGISNTVYKYSFGVQVAGGYNVSTESMDGLQLSGLLNFTNGSLFGVQIAALNIAGNTDGVNSYESSNPTGVQIGLINFGRVMNGFQFGLINIAKRSQGTQVGLINIFADGKMPNTRDGSAIGLLNFASAGYVSFYVSDIFYTNYEIGTGSTKNRRMSGDITTKKLINALTYSRNPGFTGNGQQWALGYGIKKLHLNRSTAPLMSNFRFLSYGLQLTHVNHVEKKLTKELSLLATPSVSVGSRLIPKNRNFHFFITGNYHVYLSDSKQPVTKIYEGKAAEYKKSWPGFAVGTMVGI